MRAVLDTNVNISALLIAGSVPDQVLQPARRGAYTLITSAPLVAELDVVLSRPHLSHRLDWSAGDRAEFLEALRDACIVVSPQSRITRISADPDDNRVLEAAVEGNADYIVTGDSDLLALERHEHTDIVTPARFLAILKTENLL